jgi:hypothetical protein
MGAATPHIVKNKQSNATMVLYNYNEVHSSIHIQYQYSRENKTGKYSFLNQTKMYLLTRTQLSSM